MPCFVIGGCLLTEMEQTAVHRLPAFLLFLSFPAHLFVLFWSTSMSSSASTAFTLVSLSGLNLGRSVVLAYASPEL